MKQKDWKNHPIIDNRYIDYPFIAAVGPKPFLTYVFLRRWGWSAVRSHGAAHLTDLRARGKIVAWLDHQVAAVHLQTTRQRLREYLNRLLDIGWVRHEYRLSGNRRAYEIGRQRDKGRPLIYADEFVKKCVVKFKQFHKENGPPSLSERREQVKVLRSVMEKRAAKRRRHPHLYGRFEL